MLQLCPRNGITRLKGLDILKGFFEAYDQRGPWKGCFSVFFSLPYNTAVHQ